jgi:hypothetical protein
VSSAFCVVFLFCFSSSMLPVFLKCPFMVAPSVFSNVWFELCFIWISNLLTMMVPSEGYSRHVRTSADIYVVITITGSIPLLVDY